jgi:hypothetical protein
MKHFSNIVLTSLYSLSSLYSLYSLSSTKEKQGDKEAKEANVYKGISYTLAFTFCQAISFQNWSLPVISAYFLAWEGVKNG